MNYHEIMSCPDCSEKWGLCGFHQQQEEEEKKMSEQSNFMQQMPGGICFAHGPYQRGYQCPNWPSCGSDPQKPEYIKMGLKAMPEQTAHELVLRILVQGSYGAAFNACTDDYPELAKFVEATVKLVNKRLGCEEKATKGRDVILAMMQEGWRPKKWEILES